MRPITVLPRFGTLFDVPTRKQAKVSGFAQANVPNGITPTKLGQLIQQLTLSTALNPVEGTITIDQGQIRYLISKGHLQITPEVIQKINAENARIPAPLLEKTLLAIRGQIYIKTEGATAQLDQLVKNQLHALKLVTRRLPWQSP